MDVKGDWLPVVPGQPVVPVRRCRKRDVQTPQAAAVGIRPDSR